MNMKKISIGFLFLIAAFFVMPGVLAKPTYANDMQTVYGVSVCTTCHPSGGPPPFTTYGNSFSAIQTHKSNPSGALCSIGAPAGSTINTCSTPTLTPITTVTTVIASATPVPPVATTTRAAPGFGIGLSILGLFAWSFLVKQKNK